MQNIEQIYTSCLAQGAYFIESEGEAVVIDPLRETEPYVMRARERGVKIKYIFETHFHADFVSGHLDLARKTGATIVYGPGAETDFEIHSAVDGEEFQVGKLTFKVLHTPGHTPESTTYLLLDENGKERSIFTGDTLFIGDVGRPDLAQKATGLTQEDLAGWLYDSLRNKIMVLPDDVLVYPAHGAGSACGKNMSSETWSTLGIQKATNYALRADMTKGDFISEVTDGLADPPQYFAKNAALNKKGYSSIDAVMERGTKALDISSFKEMMNQDDVMVLDVRDKTDFVKGFIPGSIFIGLDGSFAPWVGALVKDINQKILLVCPEGKETETVMRLARVGYDNAIGHLKGGIETWIEASYPIDRIETIDASDFVKVFMDNGDVKVLDVRRPGEYASSHIANAQSFPLDFIHDNVDQLDNKSKVFMHCRSGYRSTVAASIIKSKGIDNIVNVQDTFDRFVELNIPVEEVVCTKSQNSN